MNAGNKLQIAFEMAYQRRALFALELLDAVTLQRVSRGLDVAAEGLQRKPILNASGIFVWLEEDFAQLKQVTIVPRTVPYERIELDAAAIQRPLTRVKLAPRPDYRFATGVTGLRGTLIESREIAPQRPEPVKDGEFRLEWKDEDAGWHAGDTATHSNQANGSFVSFLRLAKRDQPEIQANGAITVRLQVQRRIGRRTSSDFQLQVGRITNPSTSDPLVFAWNDLQL